MIEEWRAVPDYEGLYEVSSLGQVRSLPRQTARGVRGGCLLTLQADRKGYLYVSLSHRNRVHRGYVHQLVLRAFVGPQPDGMETAHEDGVNTNNRLDNLSYKTKSGNMLDSVRHGTHRNARKQGCPECGGPYAVNGRGQRFCPACKRSGQRASYVRNADAVRDRQRGRRALDPEHRRAIERESKRRSRARRKVA